MTPKDFDIFFKSVEAQINIKNKLTSTGFEIIYECPNGFLFTYKKNSVKVQLVCRQYFSNPEELISSFDFTVTCAATNGKFLYYTRPFIKDIKREGVTNDERTKNWKNGYIIFLFI